MERGPKYQKIQSEDANIAAGDAEDNTGDQSKSDKLTVCNVSCIHIILNNQIYRYLLI